MFIALYPDLARSGYNVDLLFISQGNFFAKLVCASVLPDGLDQLPPRKMLFNVIVTKVSRVEVCIST
jgi:hypothetical protein